jgi:hypothetical protein
MRMTRPLTILAVLALLPTQALGQSNAAVESAYTTFDSDKCRHARGRDVEDYGSWLCRGFGDIPVWLGAGDQRMFVSFGRNAAREPAAGETIAGFNDAYKGTIEWRLERKPDGKLKPFATILRWNFMTNPDDRRASGRKLVVTRLGPGGVCHVGYVDARANPDANELARKLADEKARTFRCGIDKPQSVGNRPPDD